MTRLTRRAALALPFALAAPAIPRAQGSVEITVHYAQPFIFKPSYDAITEAFARAEPRICITYVNTPTCEWECRPYKSLSAIARAISGTRWNGWTFFGLQSRRGAA